MKRVVLITGASSGMGLEGLKLLAGKGYVVYGTARKKEDYDLIKKEGGHALEMEMTDYSSIEKGVKKIIKEQKRIDVLYNNAGYGLYGSVEEVPIDIAKHQFEVNLFGLARLTQLVIPHMRQQKSGKIINTSSMGGKIYTPFGAWYHASKHALEGWSDCLRLELKHFGIKVVVIEPGLIETPWNDVMERMLDKYSGKGPYKKHVSQFLERSNKATENHERSHPSVIAKVVLEAIESDRPKTRYAAGKYSKLMIFIRTKLGDRIFDKVIDLMVR
jgi:short-subunit dehydrogenase